MFKRIFKNHKYHYSLLVVVEAILLSLFVGSKDTLTQIVTALAVGIFYFVWGVITHAGQIRTPRLMLEYAVVGMLGTVMLIILTKSV